MTSSRETETRRSAYVELLRAGGEVGRNIVSRHDEGLTMSNSEYMRLTAPLGDAVAAVELIGDENVQDSAHTYFDALTEQLLNVGQTIQSRDVVKARTEFVDAARDELDYPRLQRKVTKSGATSANRI